MSRRRFVHLSGTCLAGFPITAGMIREAPRQRRWDRYDEIVVIDALGCIGWRGLPAGSALPRALEDAKASGVTAVNITVGTMGNAEGRFEQTVSDFARWEARLANHPEHLLKVRSAEDIDAAKVSGRLGVIYGFQDAAMLEGKAERLEIFHDLGVRGIQLTYNRRNELGDGVTES